MRLNEFICIGITYLCIWLIRVILCYQLDSVAWTEWKDGYDWNVFVCLHSAPQRTLTLDQQTDKMTVYCRTKKEKKRKTERHQTSGLIDAFSQYYACVYVLIHCPKIYIRSHSPPQKIVCECEWIFYLGKDAADVLHGRWWTTIESILKKEHKLHTFNSCAEQRGEAKRVRAEREREQEIIM